ncbi:Site-specific DNA methylase [Mycobacteroides abscessus subsp. abscessus]|uniref:DNA adenine methylase n=1 Tax=Mycobacteroides abscessus TaxID=36809 RepID=UPI00092961E5|nr:DNA adenine methylase [Mycobacteroides abscessus]SHU69910.1 Site-specific DNA methylase [Mycobacteroides abscessus subsp. abscessus]
MASAARWVSPLRYPGGKGRMAEALTGIFENQFGLMDVEIWIEPFAGGAGAGLHLLERNVVEEIWLTEKNPALAAFWRTVVDNGTALAARVRACHPEMSTWHAARELIATSANDPDAAIDDLDLGFAALILNRCSHSGMVHPRVGPIGGKDQNGSSNIRSRWNPDGLAERIEWIAGKSHRLRITEGDGIESIADLNGTIGCEEEAVLFVDPPYIVQGNRLYAAGLTIDDHKELAYALSGCTARWLLTYDTDPRILELYPAQRVMAYEIAYSATNRRVDEEYAIMSDNLAVLNDQNLLPTGSSRWVQHEPPLEAAADAAGGVPAETESAQEAQESL